MGQESVVLLTVVGVAIGVALCTGLGHQQKKTSKLQLGTFNWTDCGDPSTDLMWANLTITPDPIPTYGTLNITFHAIFREDVKRPVKADITIKKQVGSVWVDVPCIDNIGSCKYDDFCQILDMIGSCPTPFIDNGVPCMCPMNKGNYTLPGVGLDIGISVLPSGGYMAKMDFQMGDSRVGCFDVRFDLQ